MMFTVRYTKQDNIIILSKSCIGFLKKTDNKNTKALPEAGL